MQNMSDDIQSEEEQSFVFEDYTAPRAPKEEVQRRDDAQFMAEINAIISEGEQMRVSYMRKHRTRSMLALTFTLLFIIAGGAGFGWFLLMEYRLPLAVLSMLGAIGLSALMYWWNAGPIKEYQKSYKSVFMPKLAKALGGLKFHPKRGIPSKFLAKTRVLPPYKRYEAEDCFLGRYKGVKVIMSEARLYPEAKGGEPIFRGLMVLMEAPSKIFEGHTILTANHDMAAQWATTRWKGLTPVNMPVGNEKAARFRVFSDKPEVAVKTTGEKLLKELGETAEVFDDSAMTAVLFGGKFIFLMIPYQTDMFEASSIYVPVTTNDYAVRCKKEVDRILEIIDVFEIYKSN